MTSSANVPGSEAISEAFQQRRPRANYRHRPISMSSTMIADRPAYGELDRVPAGDPPRAGHRREQPCDFRRLRRLPRAERGHDRPHQPTILPQLRLDSGEGVAERVQAHGAQAERLGVEVLEAKGFSGPRLGLVPGLQPDPLTKLVGRGLAGPAEEAVQQEAQLLLLLVGVGPQELPG